MTPTAAIVAATVCCRPSLVALTRLDVAL